MANYIYIATTIDGFIADKDGGLAWLVEIPNPDNIDYGFADFMKKIDAVIMGRKTFEKVLSFDKWPYSKKVFVLSNTLKEIPENLSGKVELISGELKQIITNLKKKGLNNLYIDGGKTIQSFLKQDLIDEMIITRVPILLGDGIPLFAYLDRPIKFQEMETEVFNNFLVKTCYRK